MFHAQAMQQRDQARTGLIFNAEFTDDVGANLTRRARQGLADPDFQLLLLLRRQPATATFMVEPKSGG
jgi:hypothetical protein